MQPRDFTKLLLAKPQLAAAMRKDFALFCRMAWPHLHRGSPLSWTPWHDLICEWLVMVWQKKLLRLIVNCPPRFAKSSIISILWPIWIWLQDPTLDFLCCSYELDLAVNHNQDRRKLLDSKWFKDHFEDAVNLATDRSQAGEFSNVHGGTMQAASTNSRAMGRGGHVVVVDDALSGDVAYSEVFRNEVNAWFVNMLPQRLNDPSGSAIVLVQQRLHQNDPTGFLLAQEDSDWFLLKLALVAEEDERWEFPVSKRIVIRRKGECLDSKRWSKKVIRQRQGDRLLWSSQFQQSPMDPSGNMIHVDDIQYCGGRDPKTNVPDPVAPTVFDRKIISVDCTFKDRPKNDYVVLIVVGVIGSRRYILHVSRAHLNLDGTILEIRNARNVHAPVSCILVEDAANGASVVAKLSQEIPGVVAVQPLGGKLARLVATSPEFQARNWFIERNGPWAHKVAEELTMFPNCKSDDIVDAISQAAVWLQANSYDDVNAVAEWGKRDAAGDYDKRREEKRLAQKKRELATTASSVGTPPRQGPQDGDECPNPKCKSTATRVMSRGEGERYLHCNQCMSDNGVPPPNVIAGNLCPAEGCELAAKGIPMKSLPGGAWWCQNHGQISSGVAMAKGMAWRHYNAGARARSFGMGQFAIDAHSDDEISDKISRMFDLDRDRRNGGRP
jgi:predicted phage terminase large subunit-like protein